MKYLSGRYAAVYVHQGFRICTLRVASLEDNMGYAIDHEHFAGQEFCLIRDAADAIDDYVREMLDEKTPAAGTAGGTTNN